uniref:Uncharacterized protein n=1 Tax=Physcomitrium patens TaxID=3218 RepID=A0A7I3ZQS5_PHYPA
MTYILTKLTLVAYRVHILTRHRRRLRVAQSLGSHSTKQSATLRSHYGPLVPLGIRLLTVLLGIQVTAESPV